MRELFKLAREARISSATVADVLDTMGVDGVLTHELTCVNERDHYVIGSAFIVEWALCKKMADITVAQPSTWEQVKRFVDVPFASGADRVYVAGAGPLMRIGALAGGISCTYLQALGFEGVILGGAVRDAGQLDKLSMPVVASNFIPTDTQGYFKARSGAESCVIENRLVRADDVVVSDRTGTVVIPAHVASEVLQRAAELDRREDELLRVAEAGGDLIANIERMKRI
jgi:regulator of RNase E activity RraA